MPLIYNGTEIETIIYNGVQLDKLIYNGVVVWEGMPDYTVLYFNNTTTSTVTQRVGRIIKNDTTPTQVYVNDTLIATWTTAGSSVGWTDYFDMPPNEDVVVKIVGGSFYMPTSITYRSKYMYKAILGKNVVGAMILGLDGETSLTSLVIGPNVTKIDTIPDSVTSLTLSEGLIKIDNQCFNGNTGITNFNIPASVNTIESYAFGNCAQLISATIPNPNCQFGSNIFTECPVLSELYIYTTAEQTSKSESGWGGWCRGCTLTPTIHLSQSIGTIEQARTLFGSIFDLIERGRYCTVLFDL